MSILYKYLTKLAVYGLDAEILAAMMVDLAVWGANCGKMSNILKKNMVLVSNHIYF
jgi:hypothetical protein